MTLRPLLLCMALALAAGPAAADGPALWAIEGRTNTVYLFGSIHLLKAGEFDINGPLAEAYQDAEAIYLEVDLDDISPADMAAITAARAVDPDGRSLEDLLGTDAGQARELAEAIGIDLAVLSPFEPWFAGLTVVSISLMRDGYATESGVEQLIQARAAGDGKAIHGFETLDEQLAILDGMPASDQSEFLLKSLSEAQKSREAVERLVAAWRNGDTEALARELEQEFEGAEHLYGPLMVERNERWVEHLLGLLDDDDDYLVVVGALHLVGDDGLPAMLEARGHEVVRR